MNNRRVEPFSSPKVLGDVFEAIIGALFKDGGMGAVIKVLEPLLAPFITYTAKFSRQTFKEPKEELI